MSSQNFDREANTPTDPDQRIVSLDVLRGIAILGILVINIRLFAMPRRTLRYPPLFGDFSGANYYVWLLGHVFAEGTFISIFTILFGAGVLLFLRSKDEPESVGLQLHFRRNIICLSRRLARDLNELFDAHDYDSVERYPESSPFWSECFHPNAVSAEHNTDPKKVSTAPQHSEWCCPKCGCSRLHHVRSSGFERNGRYPLYECHDCRFRALESEIELQVDQSESKNL